MPQCVELGTCLPASRPSHPARLPCLDVFVEQLYDFKTVPIRYYLDDVGILHEVKGVDLLCKPGWSYPSIDKEAFKLLMQCADIPEVEVSDDVEQVITRSNAFPIPFPIQTIRLEKLKEHRPVEKLQKNIVSTYPLIHERVLLLMAHFLIYKRKFGSSIEKELYKDMSVPQLIDRFLKKRAISFVSTADFYMLRSGERGDGGWESVGTENEQPPLLLENYLSYDEMKLSAMLYVSGHTECINNGKRFNSGSVNLKGIETEAVIIGAIGPRFDRPFRMDCEDMLITEEQNVPENGYSQGVTPATDKCMWRQLWSDFYQVPSYTFDELNRISDVILEDNNSSESKYIKRFVKLGKPAHVFDNEVYYKRISIIAETVLIEADARAKEAGKMAYVHIVGCGLGVWRISKHQEDVYVLAITERVRQLLHRDMLQHVSDVIFAYITPSDSVLEMFSNSSGPGSQPSKLFLERESHPKGGINVQIKKREPSSKLSGEDEGKLLVMTYPWDGNAHPGNEFWWGCLTGSGDPAAACSTQVSELHNAHINSAVCAHNTRVAGAAGLCALPYAAERAHLRERATRDLHKRKKDK